MAPSLELGSEIQDHLKRRRSEMVDFTRQLVGIETPSLDPASQSPILDLLASTLESVGLRTTRMPGSRSGGMIVAQAPADGRPFQTMIGHCDTVWPIGTLRDMPFSSDEHTLKGPGVYDMKAGLAQMVFALAALRELKLDPPAAPVALVNSDEEIGSQDSEPMIRQLASQSDRVFILEPSLGREGQLKTARKGVGQFTIRVKGKAAHAGLEPESGVSAILELSYLIQELFALNDPERGVTVNVGMVDGGLRPNVVAADSKAVVDVRILTHEDARRIERTIFALRPVTPGVTLQISGGIGRPPLEKTERNRRLWELAREKGRQLGVQLEEGVAGGASDGNTTSLLTATLDGLGAVGGGAHALHEFVYIDKMLERSALLALLLMEPPLNSGGGS